jgi:organic radical activating enzyme
MIFNPQLKIVQHEEFARYILGKRIPVVNVEVSISSICNANCECCFYRNDKNEKEKFIDSDKLIRFLSKAYGYGLKAVTLSGGGEPTTNPDVGRISESVKMIGLSMGMFTNALAKIEYHPSLFDWIRVTKTNREFPEENIREIRAANKRIGLCINYRGSQQDDEIKQALEIAHKYDLRYVQVRPALNLMGELTYVVAPTIKDEKLDITPYKFLDCLRENRGYDRCEGFHFSPMIWENGMMSACMYMRHKKEYDIGSIYEKDFLELCASMPLSMPVAKDCQVCCKNNEINKIIHDARQVEDRNFV